MNQKQNFSKKLFRTFETGLQELNSFKIYPYVPQQGLIKRREFEAGNRYDRKICSERITKCNRK